MLVAMVACSFCILAIAVEWPRPQSGLSHTRWRELTPFGYSWFGGSLGGSLFSTKWLIHSVAKGQWNSDRWLWRIFTPFLSGGGALLVVTLSASGAVPIFGTDLVRKSPGSLGVSILVGYFSDRTFSRLERLAEKHLGPRGSSAQTDGQVSTPQA